MGRTYPLMVDDQGRIVVPAELRERLNLCVGSSLVMLDTPGGIVLATRSQMKRLVRNGLAGPSLVAELLAERRDLAAAEDDDGRPEQVRQIRR